jgi:hypothetical protein
MGHYFPAALGKYCRDGNSCRADGDDGQDDGSRGDD